MTTKKSDGEKPRVSSRRIRTDQPLPEHVRQRLIAVENQYTDYCLENRREYPDPNDPDADEADLVLSPQGILVPSGTKSFMQSARGKNRRRRSRGKNKGSSGSKGGNRNKAKGGSQKLPNPQVVASEVATTLAGLPKAGTKGNLHVLEFNALFLDVSKAKYYEDAYKEIVLRGHVSFWIEVESAALQHLASVTGYTSYCSKSNNRKQAVGFLVHPRLKVLSVTEYTQVANVQGIPDLRPAYCLELQDTTTGLVFKVVVVHQKSMRGGQQSTSSVRYQQNDVLQQVLGISFAGIVGGDWNCFLSDPKVTDCDPLKNNGFVLVYPNDKTATHAMGGRIDGWFVKGMTCKIGKLKVHQFWRNTNITRNFSDHALLKVLIIECDAAAQADPNNPNEGCKVGGVAADDADAETTDVAVVFGADRNSDLDVDASSGSHSNVSSRESAADSNDDSQPAQTRDRSSGQLAGGLEPLHLDVETDEFTESKPPKKRRTRTNNTKRTGNTIRIGVKSKTRRARASSKTQNLKSKKPKTKRATRKS
jgi:hypothetical protein